MRQYFTVEPNDRFNEIKKEISNYEKIFNDISQSQIGKYTPHRIIEIVEEFIIFLENNYDFLKNWTNTFLNINRDKLWLCYGIDAGRNYSEYWEIGKENYSDLAKTWKFLFNRSDKNYKGFIIDLKDAQNEVIRQRKRQNTTNPNFIPFHPEGCSGCSCWMLDDMEQWYTEEQKEINESKNIFFNSKLQKDFFNIAQNDLENLKDEWINWIPNKSKKHEYSNILEIKPGQTIINIVYNWIKKDFQHLILIWMFTYIDCFNHIWDNIDSIPDFIECQKEKLKKLRDLL
jgi:hypothetical protein